MVARHGASSPRPFSATDPGEATPPLSDPADPPTATPAELPTVFSSVIGLVALTSCRRWISSSSAGA